MISMKMSEIVLTFSEYEEALREGKLLGLRCKDCSKITIPPQAVCQWCGSRNLEKEELSGEGVLETFTVIRVPPEGFEDEAPYIPCLVSLAEGCKIVGRLAYDAEKASQELLGKKVRFVRAHTWKGDKFSPPRSCPLFEVVES